MSSVDCGNEKLAKDSGSRPAVSWYMDGMVSEVLRFGWGKIANQGGSSLED